MRWNKRIYYVTPRSTNRTSQLRVRIQSARQVSEQILKTEYNYHTVRPKHWHGSPGPTSVPINIKISTPAKRNAFREAWLTQYTLGKKSLGNRNTVPTLGSRFKCHRNKEEKCPFPFLFDSYRLVWVLEGTLLEPSQNWLVKTVNYYLSKLLPTITVVHIWLYVHLGT